MGYLTTIYEMKENSIQLIKYKNENNSYKGYWLTKYEENDQYFW